MGKNITRTNEEFLEILKNKKITHIPLEKYVNSQTKIKWQCKSKHTFYAIPCTILQGSGCPYCSNQKVLRGYNDLATTHPNMLNIWDFENNTISPYEKTAKSREKAWFKCKLNHKWRTSLYVASRKNYNCPYCTSHKVLRGFNDLWTTRPDVACLLKNPEDGYTITEHSNKKLCFRCPQCFTEEYKCVNLVTSHNFHCHFCSDGISYAEKFVKSLLTQLNIIYTRDNTFIWSGQKRYDFYIPDSSLIIETHGSQHYEQSKTFSRTLNEEKENDIYKKDLALSNGVKHYVELDCRVSDMLYIKNSIENSKLATLFDLSCVDWIKCNNDTFTSNIILACNLFNDKKSIDNIAELINVTRQTVVSYLKKGTECGICNYDVEAIKKNTIQNFVNSRKRKVICLETKKIYDSISDINREFGYSTSAISMCCRKTRKTSYGYHWMYYDEYIKSLKE